MFGRPKKLLPDVQIYGFIGPIPESYGGRTGACFQRTSAFADLDNRFLEILNVSPAHAVDVGELNARLHDDGRLSTRVTLRNVWNDLRTMSPDLIADFATRCPQPAVESDDSLQVDETFVSQRFADDGSLLQTDWFRPDGTRSISDRRDLSEKGARNERALSIYDHDGDMIGRWSSPTEMFKSWFQWIFDGNQTVLVSDSPAYAFIRDLRSETVTILQAIHSIHAHPPDSLTGQLSTKNYPVLTHMDEFDRVAILTRAQKDDLVRLNIGNDNLVVLPNMVKPSSTKRPKEVSPKRGIILSRLVTTKRIDQAIQGVSEASRSVPGLTLDIYGGTGDAVPGLNVLIEELGLERSVRLRGYDPNAKSRFGEASFSLLTSLSEGQPLVLLEGMAAGCIPIAYDIAYGPSDIIEHGVNGFLVPDQDIETLGRTIAHLSQMPNRELRKMRKAAAQRARDFYPAQVSSQWGDAMRRALAEKEPATKFGGRAKLQSVSVQGNRCAFTISVSGLSEGQEVGTPLLSWMSRRPRSNVFGREKCDFDSSSNAHVCVDVPRLTVPPGAISDFYIDLRVEGQPHRLRVKVGAEVLPDAGNGFELYSTKHGNLSARNHNQTAEGSS